MVDPVRATGKDSVPDIACGLSGEGIGTQAERWMRLGREAGAGRTETGDGLRIRFRDEPSVERELRALIAVERNCCPWARWEVHRVGDELVMQVSSAPEGVAALHAMFSAGPAAGRAGDGQP